MATVSSPLLLTPLLSALSPSPLPFSFHLADPILTKPIQNHGTNLPFAAMPVRFLLVYSTPSFTQCLVYLDCKLFRGGTTYNSVFVQHLAQWDAILNWALECNCKKPIKSMKISIHAGQKARKTVGRKFGKCRNSCCSLGFKKEPFFFYLKSLTTILTSVHDWHCAVVCFR